MNPIKELNTLGQSVWLDYIRRGLLDGGEFERMVREDGVSGVTSNPAIFQKAITGSHDYDQAIARLAGQGKLGTEALYEQLAIKDVRYTADLLHPVYESTHGRDGYVSLEVSPHLARDTEGTITAAHHLWNEVARPNLMIKVPATPEGLPAFETILAEGINVNITLLFSVSVYHQVGEHYLRAMEHRRSTGRELANCASVASFFLSRIDTLVDERIEQRLAEGPAAGEQAVLEALRGHTAVASAKLAYQNWKAMFSGPRWETLAAAGAHPQRLLWASTSTKNPAYSDLLYVESLIGPDTVNTIPPATLDALRDHGRPRQTLHEDIEHAAQVLESLASVGVDLTDVTDHLLVQGLELFGQAYDQLLSALAKARSKASGALAES